MELKLISRAMSELCDAGTLDDVRQVMGELFSRLDIDQYAFINTGSSVRWGGSPMLVSNYDCRWQALYRSHSYQCSDPFLQRLHRCPLPFLWSELSPGLPGCESDLAFLACARGHGIDTARGATIPAHVRGEQLSSLHISQSMTNRRAREICARDAYLLSGVATTLHLRVGQLHNGRVIGSLTRRERECLLWASHGKSQEDTSMILGISARTVRFHQENAMCKLDAVNIAAAVAAAVALGLI